MNAPLSLIDFLQLEITTFVLVMTRVAGIVLFGPLISGNSFPTSLRIYLVLAISFMVTGATQAPSLTPQNMVDIIFMMAGELLVGFTVGNMLRMMIQALQLAGQVVGQQMGLALANIFNPQLDEQASTLAAVYVTVATYIFLGMGGDREMFAALLDSFRLIPVGEVTLHASVFELVMSFFQQTMQFAVRVAAPGTIALVMTEIAMGFVGRTVPQLNFLSIGFAVRILLGTFIVMTTIRAAGVVFADQMADAFGSAYLAIDNLTSE
ncbi:flagellar biosynthesis protein FliR [Planctomycetes bacterium Pan216]|uniref:Flagellar biosynthesis protein FliR n=1 Tax=Kolteria novifilia TaxID=2527975 RepID=A0A518B958_9BACT|nr:flagellar biosynthesis protein FliR [Planctomycetes bacterium Pan216]